MLIDAAQSGLFDKLSKNSGSRKMPNELYAENAERVEYNTILEQHRTFQDLKDAGVALEPGTDSYASRFDGSGTSWNNFQDELAEQKRTGHTQAYFDEYNALKPSIWNTGFWQGIVNDLFG